MNKLITKISILLLSYAMVSACDTGFDEPDEEVFSSGSADFSHFVALGDSLTAGYADNALYLTGQTNSYPNILAQQFAKAGGGSFEQPLVSDNLGGLLFGGMVNPNFANRLVLNTNPDPAVEGEAPVPEPIAGSPTTEVIGSGLNGSVFNNMGVPGAKSFHLLAEGYGNAAGLAAGVANPYYVRFATSATSSMIADAAAQQASFYVLWIGNNDVLSYATSGGIGVDQLANPDPATYGSKDITSPAVFANVHAALVGAFKQANANVKGILINIPDVSTIPFFTTVPFNPVPLDQATADALNAAYAAYNGGVAALLVANPDEVAKRTISFSAGLSNAIVIEDEALTDLNASGLPSIRQATASDLVVLPASAKIGTEDTPGDPRTVWGLGKALEDGDVLIPSEIQAINTARLAFNATIKAAADADDNLIFVDAAAIMQELKDGGIDYGSGSIDATYGTGGAFSLDGVHLTARGYAVIANSIIDAINSGFNATIPSVNPGAHTTIFVKIP